MGKLEEKEIRYIELHCGFFRLRGRESKVHNITILIGFVVCMLAGIQVVATEILPNSPKKALRIFCTARPARRKGKDAILDYQLCN
ncbi:hypothetical protein [Algoriphagus resistens]|uniref:hypothetical protein n=1 Tax=Algoriphagus resistens TaxID=1750590 RepID=UPI000AEDED35|nr:hypothetical protein [Algoriphagus resistens]